MRLDTFDKRVFDRGVPSLVEVLWIVVQELIFTTALPGSFWRRGILRVFGAKIGKHVVIKPRVRIKFPWKIIVGDYSWVGEAAWIDNLASVTIGDHCCISQSAYFCTGNHDWSKDIFDLIAEPIFIGNQVWIGANAVVGPAVSIGEGAVLCLGGVLTKDARPWAVYAGNPASAVAERPKQ